MNWQNWRHCRRRCKNGWRNRQGDHSRWKTRRRSFSNWCEWFWKSMGYRVVMGHRKRISTAWQSVRTVLQFTGRWCTGKIRPWNLHPGQTTLRIVTFSKKAGGTVPPAFLYSVVEEFHFLTIFDCSNFDLTIQFIQIFRCKIRPVIPFHCPIGKFKTFKFFNIF